MVLVIKLLVLMMGFCMFFVFEIIFWIIGECYLFLVMNCLVNLVIIVKNGMLL